MTRYLRIAAAVMFALLAWAFIALWVRSDSKLDELSGPISDKRGAMFFSSLGVINVIAIKADPPTWPGSWRLATLQVDSTKYRWFRLKQGLLGLKIEASDKAITVCLPHWFLAACSLGVAAALGLKRPWRFTTRGLLIATTLIAVALGLGTYFL